MKVFISIWIYGRGLKINEISEVLNIDSTYKYKEGDIFISNRPNGKKFSIKKIVGLEELNHRIMKPQKIALNAS